MTTPESTTPAASNAFGRFFRSLFDLTFKSFITRRLAGVFYGIGIAIIGLTGVVMFFGWIIAGVAQLGAPYGGGAIGLLYLLGAIILVPIATFIAIVVLRIWLEALVALIAVAENTASLRK